MENPLEPVSTTDVTERKVALPDEKVADVDDYYDAGGGGDIEDTMDAVDGSFLSLQQSHVTSGLLGNAVSVDEDVAAYVSALQRQRYALNSGPYSKLPSPYIYISICISICISHIHVCSYHIDCFCFPEWKVSQSRFKLDEFAHIRRHSLQCRSGSVVTWKCDCSCPRQLFISDNIALAASVESEVMQQLLDSHSVCLHER